MKQITQDEYNALLKGKDYKRVDGIVPSSFVCICAKTGEALASILLSSDGGEHKFFEGEYEPTLQECSDTLVDALCSNTSEYITDELPKIVTSKYRTKQPEIDKEHQFRTSPHSQTTIGYVVDEIGQFDTTKSNWKSIVLRAKLRGESFDHYIPDIDPRLTWFKERIGKRVFRTRSHCNCEFCNNVTERGMILLDEEDAIAHYNNELKFEKEGCNLEYRDESDGSVIIPEKDTLVYVSDNPEQGGWHMRFYSYFNKEENRHYCFSGQKSSQTMDDKTNETCWKYISLTNPLIEDKK